MQIRKLILSHVICSRGPDSEVSCVTLTYECNGGDLCRCAYRTCTLLSKKKIQRIYTFIEETEFTTKVAFFELNKMSWFCLHSFYCSLSIVSTSLCVLGDGVCPRPQRHSEDGDGPDRDGQEPRRDVHLSARPESRLWPV